MEPIVIKGCWLEFARASYYVQLDSSKYWMLTHLLSFLGIEEEKQL